MNRFSASAGERVDKNAKAPAAMYAGRPEVGNTTDRVSRNEDPPPNLPFLAVRSGGNDATVIIEESPVNSEDEDYVDIQKLRSRGYDVSINPSAIPRSATDSIKNRGPKGKDTPHLTTWKESTERAKSYMMRYGMKFLYMAGGLPTPSDKEPWPNPDEEWVEEAYESRSKFVWRSRAYKANVLANWVFDSYNAFCFPILMVGLFLASIVNGTAALFLGYSAYYFALTFVPWTVGIGASFLRKQFQRALTRSFNWWAMFISTVLIFVTFFGLYTFFKRKSADSAKNGGTKQGGPKEKNDGPTMTWLTTLQAITGIIGAIALIVPSLLTLATGLVPSWVRYLGVWNMTHTVSADLEKCKRAFGRVETVGVATSDAAATASEAQRIARCTAPCILFRGRYDKGTEVVLKGTNQKVLLSEYIQTLGEYHLSQGVQYTLIFTTEHGDRACSSIGEKDLEDVTMFSTITQVVRGSSAAEKFLDVKSYPYAVLFTKSPFVRRYQYDHENVVPSEESSDSSAETILTHETPGSEDGVIPASVRRSVPDIRNGLETGNNDVPAPKRSVSLGAGVGLKKTPKIHNDSDSEDEFDNRFVDQGREFVTITNVICMSVTLLGSVLLIISFLIRAFGSKKNVPQGHGYFRQIVPSRVKNHIVPVYTDARSGENSATGIVDTLVKVKIDNVQYYVLTEHALKLKPFVLLNPGTKSEKKVYLEALVFHRHNDVAYIRASVLGLPGITPLSFKEPMQTTVPVVQYGFNPSDGELYIGSSLGSFDLSKGLLYYDHDTFNFQCGSPVVDGRDLAFVYGLHAGTTGNKNYARLLCRPPLVEVNTTEGGTRNTTKGQNMKAARNERNKVDFDARKQRRVEHEKANEREREKWNKTDRSERTNEDYEKYDRREKRERYATQEEFDNKWRERVPAEYHDKYARLQDEQDHLLEIMSHTSDMTIREQTAARLTTMWKEFYDTIGSTSRYVNYRREAIPVVPKNDSSDGALDTPPPQSGIVTTTSVTSTHGESTTITGSEGKESPQISTNPQRSLLTRLANTASTVVSECLSCVTPTHKPQKPPSNLPLTLSKPQLTVPSKKIPSGDKPSKSPGSNSGVDSSATKSRKRKRSKKRSTGKNPQVTPILPKAAGQKPIGVPGKSKGS